MSANHGPSTILPTTVSSHSDARPPLSASSSSSQREARRHSYDHDDGTTAAPTPENVTEHKVELQDQTNFLPRKQVFLVFGGLSAALFVALLDQTIVSTAIPSITKAFGAGNEASWLSTSYLLTSTAASPLYGRFSDIFGRKQCLIFALVVFLIGSVLCSAAQSIVQLIVFRAIAGIGGGGIVSLVMITVSDVVTLRERGTYQGLLGVIVAISNSAGPLLGGALASVSWRWCFIIAVPIILVALLSVVFLLPLKKVEGSIKEKLVKIDYLGTGLVVAGSILLLLGLNWGGQEYSWTSPSVLVTLILGLVILIAFALVEALVAPLPLVPMRLFKVGTVASVLVQTMCSGGIFYILLFFVPQYSQVVKGYSGVKAGVTLIPLMALQAITSTLAGIAVSRWGRYKAIIVVGFGIFATGVGLLELLDANSSIGMVIGFLLLSGFGAGGTLQTTLVAAQNAVDRSDLAVVTSTRNFARLFGGTLALAISYTILNNTVRNAVNLPDEVIRQVVKDPTQIRSGGFDPATTDALLSAYVRAFHNVFYFGLALVLLAFFLTLFFVKEFSLDRKDDEKRKQEGKQWYADKKERKRTRRQHRSSQDTHTPYDHSRSVSIDHQHTAAPTTDLEKGQPHHP